MKLPLPVTWDEQFRDDLSAPSFVEAAIHRFARSGTVLPHDAAQLVAEPGGSLGIVLMVRDPYRPGVAYRVRLYATDDSTIGPSLLVLDIEFSDEP